MRNQDLALSLEEFGLSRYEARAYLTLLGKGPLSASELAYYANLPRTKVYPTLTRLAKKGLAIITKDKPIICTAISPDEAFEELLSAQESKIGSMKSIVTKLQKISEESNRPSGAQERKYHTLDPDSVLTTMNELILDAKEEIVCTIDGWGLRLISQCKNAMLKSVTNKINVKILVSKDCIDSDALSSIPYGASVRIGDCVPNVFIFDKSTIAMVNSSNGKGALFRSADILSNVYSTVFNITWKNGMDTSFLAPLDRELAKTTIGLVSSINHYACGYFNSEGAKQDIIEVLESDGIKLSTIGLSDMFKVVNASLGITGSGSLRYDKNSNIITLESHGNERRIMPWFILLTNYFTHNDISANVLTGASNGNFVRIKLAKKLTLQ